MEKSPFTFLAASILSSCLLLTQAQVTKYNIPVFMNPSNAIEGQRINLTLGYAPATFFLCNWYRGAESKENLIVTVYLPPLSGNVFGPAYTGREIPDPNCSLLIGNLNYDDSGTYIVTKDGASVYGRGETSIEILAPGLLPKPSVSIIQLFREHMDSVHLKCDATVRSANVIWFQNGKPLNSSPRIRLSDDNQILTIQPLLRNDSGVYQCQGSNPLSVERSNIANISVIYGPDSLGIKMTAKFPVQPSSLKLTCKAHSFPEAEYRWFYNGKEFSKMAELLLKNIQLGNYTCQSGRQFQRAVRRKSAAGPGCLRRRTSQTASPSGAGEGPGDFPPPAGPPRLRGHPPNPRSARPACLVASPPPGTGQDRSRAPPGAAPLLRSPAGMEASRAGPPGRGSRLPARPPLRARVGGSGGGRGAGKLRRPAERGEPGVAPVEGTRWRGCGPAALLAAMLLMNSCIQLTGGQDAANTDIPVRLTPLNPTKGQNVFLTPGSDSENFTRCSWYRGTEANTVKLIFTYDQPVFYMVGDAYTSRETLGAGCSLHIEHCVMEDSGTYTMTMEGSVIATGQVNLGVSGTILHSSFRLTQAENITLIEVKPQNPMERFEVMLIPPGPADDIIICTWSRVSIDGTVKEIVMLIRSPVNMNTTGPGYTGRETIFPNCSLHIQDLELSDASNYTLTETGSGNVHVETVSFAVQEVLPKPYVTVFPSPFLVESVPVHLRCNTNITTDVKWLKDTKPVNSPYLTDDNRTLSIPSVTRNDTGGYQCQVSKTVSTAISAPAYLSVIYGPGIPVIQPTKHCYEEHSRIFLSCSADSFPQPLYFWFHNGKALYSGPILFIEDFTEDKTGNYICKAKNELLNKQTRSKVHQIYLTKSCVSEVTITGPSEAIEDKPISLTCTSRGDNVSYSWTKESQVVHPDGHIVLTNNNQTLEFNPCYRSDAADYKCHASNSFSSNESDPYHLDIIYGPDPPIINETIDVPQAQLNLTCKAAAFPVSENVWFHNGLPVAGNPRMLTLDIIPANSGNYTCRATNTHSGLIRATTLEIDMIGKRKSLKRK
ncbi:carcinoembryonic antigen-related cell adhesion molecule 3-like [Candoia aspera]|uniref:carcinoembryonic antigen-related cell adhesion molecule 3-like n=1 Tax=Candoia aspera TaxID=51853 RepID=UPI002FD83699